MSIWLQFSRRCSLLPLLLLGISCEGQELSLKAKRPAVLTSATNSPASPGTLVADGHALFLVNCAHCHAPDATGDEGPDLHGLVKSDAKLSALIKNGIKGEMPRFGSKFSDAEVRALTAFLDSMK